MKSQEKAQEIFIKCLESDILMDQISAKKSALIAVGEVISVIDPETNFKAYIFWKEVKQEIIKL